MSLTKLSEKLNQRVGEPQGFTLIRSMAAHHFDKLNWPTKKLEEWRYSPTQRLHSEFIPQILDHKNSNFRNKIKNDLADKNLLDQDLADKGFADKGFADKGFAAHGSIFNESIQSQLNLIINPQFHTLIIYKGKIFTTNNSQVQPHHLDSLAKVKKVKSDEINGDNEVEGVNRIKGFKGINAVNDQPDKESQNGFYDYEIKTLKQSLEQGAIDSQSLTNEVNKLETLNLSFFDIGFLIKINENSSVTKPIHLITIHSSEDKNPLFHTRLHILACKGSQSSIMETHLVDFENQPKPMDGSPPSFTPWINSSTQVEVQNSAQLIYTQFFESAHKQQITHRTQIQINEKSKFHLLQNSFCEGGWIRNETSISIRGSESEITLHGLGLSKNSGIVDHPSRIHFIGPNNQCHQFFKNLLFDQSKAIFNGSIKIDPSAQKSNVSQLHQSLLLSSDAEVDTKPELEIYADDVKATHGATVGQLDPEELFYFQSRGVSSEIARSILCVGFLAELYESLPDLELQNYLKKRLSHHWIKREQK